MLFKEKTLQVLPNPWSALDRYGIPCGVCPRDVDADAGGPGRFVGAKVCKKHTEILQKLDKDDTLRSAMQRTFFEYLGHPSLEPGLAEHLARCSPVEVPKTEYYLERIREGALFAADKETAALAGVHFVPPAKALSARFAPPAAPDAPEPSANATEATSDATEASAAATNTPAGDTAEALTTEQPPAKKLKGSAK